MDTGMFTGRGVVRSGFAFLVCVVMAGILSIGQAKAADLVVTSNADSGANTLREAIATANANSESDEITFDLPANERTITLSSQLEPSNGAIVIDGGREITISGNDATRIFNADGGDLTLRGLTLTRANVQNDSGGALYVNQGATVTVDSSTLTNNDAVFGLGIFSEGTLTVVDSTISGSEGAQGGGIYNLNGTLTVDSSTISGNGAFNGGGGGVYSNTANYAPGSTPPASRTTIINSTIANNAGSGGGSGVYNENGYTEISYSTIANNTSSDSSTSDTGSSFGVQSEGTDTTGTRLTGNIIVGNTSAGQSADAGNSPGIVPGDNDRPYESGGGNVIGAGRTGDFTAAGDRTGQKPVQAFGTTIPNLAPNGGPTQTISLEEGSVAIDNAPSGPDVDQRGVARPFDDPAVTNPNGSDGTDSGAFEKSDDRPTDALVVNSNANTDDGACTGDDCTLREAVSQANASSVTNEITFDLPEGSRTITLSGGPVTTTGTMAIDGGSEIMVSGDATTQILDASSSSLTLRNITLTDGSADSGGAMSVSQGATVLVDSSTISDSNSSDISGGGGGIRNSGNLTLDSSTVSGNRSATYGGGIYNSGALTLGSSTVSGNNSGLGGGIANDLEGSVEATTSTISGNTASEGGGVYNLSAFRLDSATVSGNNADEGGGIFNVDGVLTVDSSTISGNVGQVGGGITSSTANYPPNSTPPASRTTITNSTIANNSSPNVGSGIFNGGGYTEIGYSTVASNTSTSQNVFGVENGPDSIAGTRLTATIVVGNTSDGQPADVTRDNRPFENGDDNVIGSGTTDDFRTEPVSVAEIFGTSTPTLADNGGPTRTIAIVPGSVAVNRISGEDTGGVPATDQRGIERPQFQLSDTGSYELDEAPTITISPDSLPDAFQGQSYSQQLTASGSNGGYEFFVSDGSLPDGLTLSDGGLISGTPTATADTRTFTVEALDRSNFSGERRYTLIVIGTNGPPTFTLGDDQAVDVNSGQQTIERFVTEIDDGDAGVEQNVTFTVTNDNSDLFTGNGQPAISSEGTLTYTSAPGAEGTATVTVIAQDDGGTENGGNDTSEEDTFTITVGESNDAPEITDIRDRIIKVNSRTGALRFRVSDPNDPANILEVSAKSSNTKLVKRSGIKLTKRGEDRTVTVIPLKNRTGSTRITLTVTDSEGLKATASFVVKVRRVVD